MKIEHSSFTISDIKGMISRKDMRINPQYQRSSDVWPISAKSYFIDTILENFPFPKIYIYQAYDKIDKRSIKEIIDGQQRITTILDYLEDGFKLSTMSKKYSTKKFSDLDEDLQERFMMYPVPTDLVLNATRPEILEMFRRMNSYTAPLNEAEKRHSNYGGAFKWMILDLCERQTEYLVNWGVLTERQVIRMADAEFFADLALIIHSGIKSKSSKQLDELYKINEDEYPELDKTKSIIESFFMWLIIDAQELTQTFMMKPYAFYSLFAAYAHFKIGIPDGVEDLGFSTIGKRFKPSSDSIKQLVRMATAHERQELSGKFKIYVEACLSTTTKRNQRIDRAKAICEAFEK